MQLPVHRRPLSSEGVGGEAPIRQCSGPPGCAGVLLLHAGGDDSLREESGVVHDEDAVRGAERVLYGSL